MRLRDGVRVLDRGDGTLQVGVRVGVVLPGLTAAQRRFVERLEGGREVTQTERRTHAGLISLLDEAGLFAAPAQRAASVAIDDGGPVGIAVGAALARAGWAVRYTDSGIAAGSPPHTYPPDAVASTRQAAAAATVEGMVHGADVRVGAFGIDVWVLVSSGAANLAAAVPHMAADVPHLFVVADEDGVVVGPLVLPGEGACGTCAGLARVARDPSWPTLALQLGAGPATPARAEPDVTAQAAGLVTGALQAWRRGDANPWLNRVWVLTASAPPMVQAALAEPTCGCGAAGPVGDELAARRARFNVQ